MTDRDLKRINALHSIYATSHWNPGDQTCQKSSGASNLASFHQMTRLCCSLETHLLLLTLLWRLAFLCPVVAGRWGLLPPGQLQAHHQPFSN